MPDALPLAREAPVETAPAQPAAPPRQERPQAGAWVLPWVLAALGVLTTLAFLR